jgi:hypothetical protein
MRASNAIVLASAFFLAFAGRVSAQSDPLNNWHWRNPLPGGNRLNSLTYADGFFTAVGNGATVLTSTDGVQWAQQAFPVNGTLQSIVHGNGMFITVGGTLTINPLIGVSTNGRDWFAITNTTQMGPTDVAFGDGRFVALCRSFPASAALVSSNGADWAAYPIEDAYTLNAITYANGLFIAVGRNYEFISDTQETRILTSPDGINWTKQALPIMASPYQPALNGIIFGGGQFLAVGEYDSYNDGGPLLLSSPDGTNWTQRYYPEVVGLGAVLYANDSFAAMGGFWDGERWNPGTITSSDGIHWRSQPISGVSGTTAIGWGAGTFVVLGGYGEILTSSDGDHWTNHLQGFYGEALSINAVVSSTNIVVAATLNGMLTSSNGLDWTNIEFGPDYDAVQEDTLYAQGKFVAVGSISGAYGLVRVSEDGLNWSTGSADFMLQGIAYGNGRFVAVGGSCYDSSGGVTYSITSTDGETWLDHYGTNGPIEAVAFGNGIFVGVGSSDECDGTALISTDGANWMALDSHSFATKLPNGDKTYLWPSKVVYGNGRFVAASASSGDIWVSIDGRTWRNSSLSNWKGSYVNIKGLVYLNRSFFAVVGPSLFKSEDGLNWTSTSVRASFGISGLTYFKESYIVAGWSGTILQSDPVPPTNTGFGLALSFASFPELAITGGINRAFSIEYRDDLSSAVSWQAVSNVYPTASPFHWADSSAVSVRQRFYRVTMLP